MKRENLPWLGLIALVGILSWCLSHAAKADLVENAEIRFRSFMSGSTVAELPGFPVAESIALDLRLAPLPFLFLDSTVEGISGDSKFEFVAWKPALGFRFKLFTVPIEARAVHLSGHCLDRYCGNYPNANWAELRVKIK